MDDKKSFSAHEKMFDYYFSLKLRNGSTVDVPAGQTAFIPVSSPLIQSPKTTVTIKVERPSEDRTMWRMDYIGNCVGFLSRGTSDFAEADFRLSQTSDNTTRFEVDVEMPSNDLIFQSGESQQSFLLSSALTALSKKAKSCGSTRPFAE